VDRPGANHLGPDGNDVDDSVDSTAAAGSSSLLSWELHESAMAVAGEKRAGREGRTLGACDR
jgi:hypothetical protein